MRASFLPILMVLVGDILCADGPTIATNQSTVPANQPTAPTNQTVEPFLKPRGKFNCTSSDIRTGQPSIVNESGKLIAIETFEFPGLTEGSSVCYLRDAEVDGLNMTLQYRVTIENVTATYSVKDEYKFGIPQLDATCTCQCTKGTEATDCPKIDRCSDDDINCVEWNDLSDNTKGCFLGAVKQVAGRSRICCKIFVTSDETYTSYKINQTKPTVSARVRTSVYLHESDHLLYTSTHRFSTTGTSGSTQIEGISASLTPTSITTNEIPAFENERYYNSEKDGNVLTTEELMNAKDKNEVTRFGWLKVTQNQEFQWKRRQFKRYFNATVQDCAESELRPRFYGTHSSPPDYQTLQSKYSTKVSSIKRNTEGKIEVNSLKSVIDLSLVQKKQDFILHTDVVSKVTNFTAVLFMDKNSNRYLNISLTDTSGLLRGHLRAGNKSEVFRLLLQEGTLEHIQPIAVECVDNDTTLCLEAVWGAKSNLSSKCIDVKCETIALDSAEEKNSTIDYTIGEKESILSPRSWLKFANPAEWFNGIDSAAEGFIIAVVVIIIIIVLSFIICFIRCFCCFYKCCKCCKICKKKRNRNEYNGHEVFQGTNL